MESRPYSVDIILSRESIVLLNNFCFIAGFLKLSYIYTIIYFEVTFQKIS